MSLVRDVYNAPAVFVSGDDKILAAAEPPILVDGKPGVPRVTAWAARQGAGFARPRPKLHFNVQQDTGAPTNHPTFTGTLSIDDKPVGRAVQGRAKKLVKHQ
jgi:hypothetical protein